MFGIHEFFCYGVGIVIGAFIPSVGRAIKSFFVTETQKVEPAVKAAAGKVTSTVETAVINTIKKA